MAGRRGGLDEDFDDPDDLDEGVDDGDDLDDDDDDETVPCPSCGEAVYEDAERCPSCGWYITPGSGSGRPLWIVLGVVFCLGVVIRWILFL